VPETTRVLCPPEVAEQQYIKAVPRCGTERLYATQELSTGFTDQMRFRDPHSRSGATRGVLSDSELEKASRFWQGPSGGMPGPGVPVDGASRRRSLDNAVTPFYYTR